MALHIFFKGQVSQLPHFHESLGNYTHGNFISSVFLVILSTFLPAPAWQWLPLETLFQLTESIEIGDAK